MNHGMKRKNSLNNIVLIGMSGAGKSTVGKYIADKLKMRFVDTDDIIVTNSGKTIKHIFAEYGEEYFRRLEKEVITKLAPVSNTVIATGGGVVLDRANIELLKINGIIFFLEASIDTLVYNIERAAYKEHRPLIENSNNKRSRIERLYSSRERLYRESADYSIKTDNKSIAQIGDEIIFIFKNIDPCS